MTDLTDRHQLIEIAQRVKLPLFLVNVDVVLGDALQSQLISLHEDPNRLVHELLGHLKGLRWHRRREESHLNS